MKTISYRNVTLTSGYWKEKQLLNENVTIYSVYDRFYDTGRIEAFKFNYKDGMANRPHIFWDSDVAKWIEAAAYILNKKEDKLLESRVDELIDLIEINQQEDGYFNIYFSIIEPDKKFTLRDCHELYCAGHLMEAAVAYYEATGKDKLLKCMEKYAACIEKAFIIEKTAKFITPGHEEIELALVKMYNCTKNAKYLKMAKFFIDNRGVGKDIENFYPQFNEKYAQNHMPVRKQKTAEGHAVRACYLYSGMCDVAYETNDSELYLACKELFNDIVNRKMYITGGIGSSPIGEAFTIPYDLPNETAYAETCAAISLAFFANRIIRINADSKYADAVEKVMYNGALSGISMDGKGFFYENPLEIDVDFNNVHPCTNGGRRYPITQRKEVFDCSCCPPNVTRFIQGIGEYMYSYTDDTLFIHQYIESQMKLENTVVTQKTSYPSEGEVVIKLENNTKNFVALRIPGWCKEFTVNKEYTLEKGYIYIKATPADEIKINFSMPIRFISANKKVHTNSGRVAIMRGPVVYCLEGVDNGKDLSGLKVDIKGEAQVVDGEFLVPDIVAKGFKEVENDSLYFDATDEYVETSLKFIPYYAYANRGETDMLVWVLKK